MNVTAIIPCHNHARWINDAIDSVLAQTHSVGHIVVVDDGSTDGSAEEVKGRLEKMESTPPDVVPHVSVGILKDCRVMVVEFPEAQGPAAARNYGIKAAWDQTDVFAFLDSDDLYAPEKVEASLEELTLEGVGAVYSDYDCLHPDGRRIREYKPPFSRRKLLQECIVNCNSLVKKAALENCGLFDEGLRVCEDYDLWLRISEKFLISHVARSLITIRVGEHSSTSTVDKERWKACYQRVFEKLHERNG